MSLSNHTHNSNRLVSPNRFPSGFAMRSFRAEPPGCSVTAAPQQDTRGGGRPQGLTHAKLLGIEATMTKRSKGIVKRSYHITKIANTKK